MVRRRWLEGTETCGSVEKAQVLARVDVPTAPSKRRKTALAVKDWFLLSLFGSTALMSVRCHAKVLATLFLDLVAIQRERLGRRVIYPLDLWKVPPSPLLQPRQSREKISI